MKIKFPTGSTAENNQLVLPEGMLSIDIEKKAVRLHDGLTQGGFEVVGQRALVLGYFWTEVNLGFGDSNALNLYHVNNTWFVGGWQGKISRSTDGLNWTTQQLPDAGDMRGFAYGNGVYVTVGSSGIWSSPDGVVWTKRNSQLGTAHANRVEYGNGYFLVVGNSGKLVRSTDGINWSTLQSPTWAAGSHINTLCFVGGRFWSTSHPARGFAWSVNGTTWNLVPVPQLADRYATSIVLIDEDIYFGINGVANKLFGFNVSNQTVTEYPDLPTSSFASLAKVGDGLIAVDLSPTLGGVFNTPTNPPTSWTKQSFDSAHQCVAVKSTDDTVIITGRAGVVFVSKV